MKKLIVVMISVLVITTGCQSQDIEWGYGQDNGPDTWASLSDDYQLCGNGQAQSPIDIETSKAVEGTNDESFTYEDSEFDVIDTGHSVEFEDESGQNYIVYNDEEYTLQQIHFHNQSENTIDGKHYPLEAHFVHSNKAGQNLVVSVMFEVGEENQVIADNFTKVGEVVDFNPGELIPEDSVYYSFIGSLTTPPCSENVQWLVFATPLSISATQLEEFNVYYENNNRDIQPINQRMVGVA